MFQNHGVGFVVSPITFLAPDETLHVQAKAVLAADHADIALVTGLLGRGVKIASRLIAGGTEILIARGGTASAIRKAGLEVVVVEIPITGFDIIQTVEEAKHFGRVIGAVAFSSMIRGIGCLSSSLGIEIRLYPITDEIEAPATVAQAIADGADAVIGGYITGNAAAELGVPCVIIKSSGEAFLQAAEEAKRIAYARNIEKTKTGLFRAVLDYSYEGIISVDSRLAVTFFNPVAEKILNTRSEKVLGKSIASLWPMLDVTDVVCSMRDETRQIVSINNTDIMCNKAPIMVDGAAVGAVIAFQDVTQIQQMEAKVRHRFYASGHVASFTFPDIVCRSPAMERIKEVAQEFSLLDLSILIEGETGTGKELFAQSCHRSSPHASGPFVAINCAALPRDILESELFGYVGGAFTGASPKGKPGLFEIAHGGTIFLDEVSEIDRVTQGKLLRILQERKVMRLGSDRVVPFDVRVITATNRNLRELVARNKFRSDLYFRLDVLHIRIPPLRQRKGDITLLAERFLAKRRGDRELAFSPAALRELERYDWPGNVRELQNVVERAIVACKGSTVDVHILRDILDDQAPATTPGERETFEVSRIREALVEAKWKYAPAAQSLGISRTTLWRKIKLYGIA